MTLLINFYTELNLDQNSSIHEIKEDITRLFKVWQARVNAPDFKRRQEAEKMCQILLEAEKILLNQEKRKNYDEQLKKVNEREEPDSKSDKSDSSDKINQFQPTLMTTIKCYTDLDNCIYFTPNARMIASAGEKRIITLWHVKTGQIAKQFEGHKGSIQTLLVSPDGKMLVSGSAKDRTVRCWSLETDLPIGTFQYNGYNNLIFTPNGKQLISKWTSRISSNPSIVFFNDFSSIKTLEVEGHLHAINLSPNGDLIGISREIMKNYPMLLVTQTISIVRVKDFFEIAKINTGEKIDTLCFNDDNTKLAAATKSGIIEFYDISNGQIRLLNKIHAYRSNLSSFDTEQTFICSTHDVFITASTFDNTIKIWDFIGNLKDNITVANSGIRDIKISSNNMNLGVLRDNATIEIWKLYN